ncbi:hypothetical protein C8J57DRAFT_377978 [Mycena rebaudengoi]|nr:hypothetical protein C8J57DRAFT_377978 [Mycena rebaudengoi]
MCVAQATPLRRRRSWVRCPSFHSTQYLTRSSLGGGVVMLSSSSPACPASRSWTSSRVRLHTSRLRHRSPSAHAQPPHDAPRQVRLDTRSDGNLYTARPDALRLAPGQAAIEWQCSRVLPTVKTKTGAPSARVSARCSAKRTRVPMAHAALVDGAVLGSYVFVFSSFRFFPSTYNHHLPFILLLLPCARAPASSCAGPGCSSSSTASSSSTTACPASRCWTSSRVRLHTSRLCDRGPRAPA